MIQYCFRCSVCGGTVETPIRDPAPTCEHAEAIYFTRAHAPECVMIRDWKAEGVIIDQTAFNHGAAGSPANPAGIRKKLVGPNVPDPW